MTARHTTGPVDLEARLAELARQEPERVCLPVPYELGQPAQRRALGELLASGRVARVHDRIQAQLEDLVRCRQPGSDLDDDTLAAAVAAITPKG